MGSLLPQHVRNSQPFCSDLCTVYNDGIPFNSGRPPNLARLSKKMSWFLRHGAVSCDVVMGSDGYVRVNDMLRQTEFNRYTIEDVMRCVSENKKLRFCTKVEEGVTYIRAQQGHSLKIVDPERLLTRITDSADCPVCLHGTHIERLDDILKTGLKTMDRNHIHFTPGANNKIGPIVSGARSSSNTFIHVDVQKAMANGIKFYRSTNNVILTAGIEGTLPTEFFIKVTGVRGDTIKEMGSR